MFTIQNDKEIRINRVINQAYESTNDHVQIDIHEQHKVRLRTVLDSKSLTKDEKDEAIKYLTLIYDSDKVLYNKGTKRICEICNKECLATLYCELCIRIYLEEQFSSWTPTNDVINSLIQKCQMETLKQDMVIEWIPYDNLQNIEYLKKGGCSKIYTADWIDGHYNEWDSKEKKLKRFGKRGVILKTLENNENNDEWFEEVCNFVFLI